MVRPNTTASDESVEMANAEALRSSTVRRGQSGHRDRVVRGRHWTTLVRRLVPAPGEPLTRVYASGWRPPSSDHSDTASHQCIIFPSISCPSPAENLLPLTTLQLKRKEPVTDLPPETGNIDGRDRYSLRIRPKLRGADSEGVTSSPIHVLCH